MLRWNITIALRLVGGINAPVTCAEIGMAYEIERKFMVRHEGWREHAGPGRSLRQAYLAHDGAASIRIRLIDERRATLTIKSRAATLRRQEFEYEIPAADGAELLTLRQGAVIEKVRFKVPCGALTWEIDVFEGDNRGLVLAEIELKHEAQEFERPLWLGDEVTSDARFYNASLARHPFRRWEISPTRLAQ